MDHSGIGRLVVGVGDSKSILKLSPSQGQSLMRSDLVRWPAKGEIMGIMPVVVLWRFGLLARLGCLFRSLFL